MEAGDFLDSVSELRIGFIGAGQVGTAFGLYLKAKGFDITGYFSKTPESAEKAAKLTGSQCFFSDRALLEKTDMVFITTPDAQIQPVCNVLAEKNYFRRGQILIHMSGALSSEILARAKEKGCYTYSLHPIQSFANIEKSLSMLKSTVFSLEGASEKIHVLEDMLRQTGNHCFRLRTEQKVLYHAATCIFSNYLTTLLEEGLKCFEAIDIPKEEGLKAVLPLVRGTIDNIALLGTQAALTGPIARGDSETLTQHLAHIGQKLPDELAFYKLMAKHTFELAIQNKLKDQDKIKAMSYLLSSDIL